MNKALIDRLKIGCFGLDPIDPLRVLLDEVIEALAQPTSGDYALGYCEGFNDACKPKPAQQEPVAWINAEKRTFEWNGPVLWGTPTVAVLDKIPLYTTPPQRTWVGLTKDEQNFVYRDLHNATSRTDSFWVDFANAIEAKLKEKNNDS
jgi:hypothetical protein